MANKENEYGKIPDKIIGVYKIECDGRCYVGSSSRSISGRWRMHMYNLIHNQHINPHMQNVFNKYGKDSFFFSVLKIVEDPNCVVDCEQEYIDKLKPELNICPIAGSKLGKKHSEETKLKMRESTLGYIMSEETKQKLRDRVITDEIRQHMSDGQKGRKLSEETKQKLREKVFSEETRKKMSASLLGKSRSKESIQKQKETRLKNKLLKEKLTNDNIAE